MFGRRLRQADAREFNVVSAALIIVALKLVDHESVVTILEDGYVLKLPQEHRYFVSRHEESSEEHKRNNQHWSKRNSQLLVRETAGNDQRVATTSVVDQSQYRQEKSKFFKPVHLTHTNSEVNDGSK
jgi:hypothetical protein